MANSNRRKPKAPSLVALIGAVLMIFVPLTLLATGQLWVFQKPIEWLFNDFYGAMKQEGERQRTEFEKRQGQKAP